MDKEILPGAGEEQDLSLLLSSHRADQSTGCKPHLHRRRHYLYSLSSLHSVQGEIPNYSVVWMSKAHRPCLNTWSLVDGTAREGLGAAFLRRSSITS